MSAILLPGIEALDPESLCYSIYTQLYQNFFNAQDAGTVTEGDPTSIRLRNTAYGFAEAIAGGVTGDGGASGGALSAYLKRSGGDMSGLLHAHYGFSAGIGNTRVLEVFDEPLIDAHGEVTGYDLGVRISGNIKVEDGSFYLSGHKILSYDAAMGTMLFRHPRIDFATSSLHCGGEMLFGEDKTCGVYLSATTLRMAGHDVYHTGNAGHAGADWTMRDATVCGALSVDGSITLRGSLTSLHGAALGFGGNSFLSITGDAVVLSSDLDMRGSHAIRFGGYPVLSLSEEKGLRISAPGGDLLLGGEPASRIRLMTPLTDEQGSRTLITHTGGAWFPDSLRAGHNFGGDLLSTYRQDDQDQGIVIHGRLRFGCESDAYMQGIYGQWGFCSQSDHTAEPGGKMQEVITIMGHIPSTSLLAPQNRPSDTFAISTQADFIFLGNRVEAELSLGVAGSLTRLERECLSLNDVHRLQSVAGGIKHYGQALFMEGVSSERFSSGLAGSGWAILTNRTTGHADATFDTVTVRRRMRIYELEVQRARTTNGALWISDACSGDSVERIL